MEPRPTRAGVVPGRLELPTSTLSVWRSNQLSYRTVEERQRKRAATCPLRSAFPSENMSSHQTNDAQGKSLRHLPHNGGKRKDDRRTRRTELSCAFTPLTPQKGNAALQKGGVPAAPSGTATLLRLPGFHGLTGGVYKARERIHRAMADARLLANPASRSRVADSGPNWGTLSGSAPRRRVAPLCMPHCNTCVAPDVRAVLI